MKIEIHCNKCGEVLTDAFQAKDCSLVLNEDYTLPVECLKCGELKRIKGGFHKAVAESENPLPQNCPKCEHDFVVSRLSERISDQLSVVATCQQCYHEWMSIIDAYDYDRYFNR